MIIVRLKKQPGPATWPVLYAAVQGQNTVTDYFTNEQLLL